MKKQILVIGIIIIALLFAGCNGDNGSTITFHEGYFLAYAQAGTSNIIVRHSDDGITWEDGDFPSDAIGTSFRGVGAIADENGLFHVVMSDEPNAISFMWGLGPNIWDTSDNPESSHEPHSAPSGAWIDSDHWVTAFRHEETILVSVYDHDRRDFFPTGVEPTGSLNTEVIGRPAVTQMDGKILLTWRRYGGGDVYSLITSVGEIDSSSGIPYFSAPQEIPLPFDTEYKGGLEADPAATHDHNQFYIAITREGQGSPLHGWWVVVYSSTDGVNWQYHSQIAALDVTNSDDSYPHSFINIAGRSDGTLIAAAITGTPPYGEITAARYDGSTWSGLSEEEVEDMFGAIRAYPKPFALIGTGPPET
jgi:hypothetical protein